MCGSSASIHFDLERSDGADGSREVSAPDEVAIVHVMNCVVRRCYLLGNDPVSGKNYDNRKVMI